MKYRIGKTFRFEAGHFLPNVPEGHKCRRQHGHNYQVTVHLEAKHLADAGWVFDYGDLQPFKEALEGYDHENLNDFIQNPTAEILAANFFLLAEATLSLPHTVTVHSVTVRETDNTYATVSL